MPSFTSVAVLLSAAALVSAQGRFPCSQLVNGVVTPFPERCTPGPPTPDAPVITAGQVNGGLKQNAAAPVNSECVLDTVTANWFCGYLGAACTDATNCDSGSCTGGVCTGGVGTACGGLDSACIGHLYCTDPSGFTTTSNVCGGSSTPLAAGQAVDATHPQGAFCDDGTASDYANNFCVTGYCDPNSNACSVAPVASGGARARSRRSDLATRGAKCPASHTACSVAGSARGFECIDVTSNLEQCGACASAGGVDCTALPGVDAVGCVAGKCEIWACAEGFAWDASSASCTVALTM